MFRAANLVSHINSWRNIDAPKEVLRWIEFGVDLPFDQGLVPKSFCVPNRQLSPSQELFVDAEIKKLLCSGAIVQCDNRPTCISPLGLVPKKPNSYRLIHDLRKINAHISFPRYQQEDIRNVKDVVSHGDLMISLDIKKMVSTTSQ